jgi:Mrp family chromosome partitioning ATPase
MIDSSSILFRVSSPADCDDTPTPTDDIEQANEVLDTSDQTEDAPTVELVPARSHPSITQQRSALRSVEAINSNITADSRLVVHSAPYGIGAYRYRMLRVYLQALWRAGKVKSLLVTSALPCEGKTTAALNLAVGLAEHGGGTVVVVEADFRRPSVHRQLGLTPWPGFVHCLQNNIDPLTAVRRVDPLHIYLLPAGEVAAQPIELLNSEEFSTTMTRL